MEGVDNIERYLGDFTLWYADFSKRRNAALKEKPLKTHDVEKLTRSFAWLSFDYNGSYSLKEVSLDSVARGKDARFLALERELSDKLVEFGQKHGSVVKPYIASFSSVDHPQYGAAKSPPEYNIWIQAFEFYLPENQKAAAMLLGENLRFAFAPRAVLPGEKMTGKDAPFHGAWRYYTDPRGDEYGRLHFSLFDGEGNFFLGGQSDLKNLKFEAARDFNAPYHLDDLFLKEDKLGDGTLIAFLKLLNPEK